MKKALILAVFMILVSSFNALAQVPGVTADSIKLGAIPDMSGPATYTMMQELYGELTYFRKANAEGIYKRKIELIAEDGGYDPGKHIAAAKLLLDRDKVFCLTLTCGATPTLAVNTLLEAQKVPLLCAGAQARSLAVPFQKYLFVQMTSYYDQARIVVDFIHEKIPKARIVMIYGEDDFGNEGKDGFLAQCKKYGIEPAGLVSYQRANKDFSSQVLKIKSLNPDYVYNHCYATTGAAILKEAQKLGFKAKWVYTGGVSEQTLKLAGDSVEFAEDVTGLRVEYQPGGDSEGAIEYREAIKKYEPKAEVDFASIVGYGFGKLIVEGLKRAEAANDLTREGIIKAFETFRNVDTKVFPPITYTSTSHAGPDACLISKPKNQAWVPITGQWTKAK